MVKHSTHLFSIDIPERFEKVLQMGQLLRCERMSRDPEESSFAELNLWVGEVEFEHLGIATDTSKPDILKALWQKELTDEARAEALLADHLVQHHITENRIEATLKLAPTSWRPLSGQVIRLEVFESSPQTYLRYHLEFDWALSDLYRSLASQMLSSLEWRVNSLDSAELKLQEGQRYSIFEAMPQEKKEAITTRYQEILGRSQAVLSEETEPPLLDLRNSPSSEKLSSLLEEYRSLNSEGGHRWYLKLDLLPTPLSFELYGLAADSPLPSALLKRLEALANMGEVDQLRASELLWEHCQLCFEMIDYGAGEQSNQDFFGIHGPEEAWAQCGDASVWLDLEDDEEQGLALQFYPPWEDEHGCALVLENDSFSSWRE